MIQYKAEKSISIKFPSTATEISFYMKIQLCILQGA